GGHVGDQARDVPAERQRIAEHEHLQRPRWRWGWWRGGGLVGWGRAAAPAKEEAGGERRGTKAHSGDPRCEAKGMGRGSRVTGRAGIGRSGPWGMTRGRS